MKKEDIYYWESGSMNGRNSIYQYGGCLTLSDGQKIQHLVSHPVSLNEPKEWFDLFKSNAKEEIERVIMEKYEKARDRNNG